MANYAEKPQMGFIEACSTACKKIVTFKGRARRSEFWWAVFGLAAIFYGILSMDINIFELIETPDMLSQEIIENMSNSTSMNIMAGTFLFFISGLLSIVVFVFCCLDSKPGTNKYGESPKYVEEA